MMDNIRELYYDMCNFANNNNMHFVCKFTKDIFTHEPIPCVMYSKDIFNCVDVSDMWDTKLKCINVPYVILVDGEDIHGSCKEFL